MTKDEFIKKVVFGWIKKDFERMLEIKVIPNGDGNINFPLTLCALADMEYLGSLLIGSDCGFNKCVGEYISRCFARPQEYPIEILGDIFRHSLAHEFFARGGICRNGKHPAIFMDDKLGIILDADTLVIDFLGSLEKFKNNLSEENYRIRMAQTEESIKVRLEKHRGIIGRLPRKIDSSISTSTSAVSGHSDPYLHTTTFPPSDSNFSSK